MGRGRGSAGAQASGQKGVSEGCGLRWVRDPLPASSGATRGYKWTYLYGFVHPRSGKVFWLILPTVNTELFSLALEEFAKEVGAGKEEHILLVVDQAGWHTGGEVKLPEGIHLEFLPSGSPELQPAERLWPLSNEALANSLSLRRSKRSSRRSCTGAYSCSIKPS